MSNDKNKDGVFQHKIENKWRNMHKKGMINYIIVNQIVCRYVPIMIILSVLDIMVSKGANLGTKDGVLIITKVILGAVLGGVIGILDWYFYENLFKGEYSNIEYVKKMHVFIYGILSWGLLFAIGTIKYPVNIYELVVQSIIWVIAGLFFGLFMWTFNKESYEQYIK